MCLNTHTDVNTYMHNYTMGNGIMMIINKFLMPTLETQRHETMCVCESV